MHSLYEVSFNYLGRRNRQSVKGGQIMEIENDRINYRRANIDDVEFLIDFRVRFLDELYNHPEDGEAEILRKALHEYFSEAIPSNDFIA